MDDRGDRMVRMAAISAARMMRRANAIRERYIPQEFSLSSDDALREMEERGHLYDPNCESAFCIQAGMMLAQAQQSLQQQLQGQASDAQ